MQQPEGPSIRNNFQFNWPETVLQNINGLLHVLSPDGRILYCSESCTELTGYQPSELAGRYLTEYIHADDLTTFINNFQYAYQTQTRVKIHYRLRCKNDSYMLLEFIGQPKRELPDNSTALFFGIAQPYLSRSNGLLDSYMEIRMEYEWFKKRVYEILSAQNETVIPQQEDYASVPQEENYAAYLEPMQFYNIPTTNTAAVAAANTTIPATSSTRSNSLDETNHSNWQQIPSSSSTEEPNPVTQVLPNLKINDIVFGDQWKRRKHSKSVDGYVCNDCGATSSPEWRRGPNGPKTLCNACGLRWSKRNKKDSKDN